MSVAGAPFFAVCRFPQIHTCKLPDAMEPEVVAFLKRVALCIFIAFCWLAVTVTIGLKFDLAFVDGHVSLGNILFYLWMVASFVVMILYFIRIWKNVAKW